VIHRFVELFETTPLPILPMLSQDFVTGEYVVWEIGNGAAPVRVESTDETFDSGNAIADTQVSPDGTEFVYSFVGSGGGFFNTVRRVAWDDSSNVVIASAPNANNNGYSISLQPSWSPDGTQVVYRDTSFDTFDPTVAMKIKRVDRDGTNDTVLFDNNDNNFRLFNPLYSPDGNYIAFTSRETAPASSFKYRLHVMESDGSNETVIVGPLNGGSGDTIPLLNDTVAWMHGQNTLAYLQYLSGTDASADWEWHRIDFDGTNDTTLHTIDRAGYTDSEWDPGPTYGSWLADDSGLVTFLLDLGSGLHEMTVIGAGGGATGTGLTVDYDGYANDDNRPLVFQGRIYYPGAAPFGGFVEVESVPVGSTTPRNEFDGTIYSPSDDVFFTGFRGDA